MPQMENTCNTLASDFWAGGGGGGVNLDLCAWGADLESHVNTKTTEIFFISLYSIISMYVCVSFWYNHIPVEG